MKQIATKMTQEDFMNLAYEEMLKSVQDIDSEKISPKVGAVIVFEQDGKSYYDSAHRGQTRDGHHAEETLLDDLHTQTNLTNAEMYVTLEPCVPDGRSSGTVSCAERIVDARISKVFIGMIDPNPNIKNKGIQFLLSHNVAVQMFEPSIRKKIETANAPFLQSSFSNIDHVKMESDILVDLSEEALKTYAKSVGINIEQGYGNLWNHFLSKKLIFKDGKNYKVSQSCGIAFGKCANQFCLGAQVQLYIHFSKENILNKTGQNLEHREMYNGPMILITKKLKEWLKDHFFINQNRSDQTEDFIVPYESIKEAVVNAIAHREYGENGSYSYQNIDDYSLIIKNPCKLAASRLENIRNFRANSIPTNAELTELFIGTQLMNRSGAGMETFKKTSPLPFFEYDGDFLSLSFPYSHRNAFILFSEKYPHVTQEEFNVLSFFSNRENVTRLMIESEFNLTPKTANNRLNKLEKEGLIEKTGSGRSTQYRSK